MVLNPFLASGTFDQDERFPKNGLFGFATGSGLLSIRTKPILTVLTVHRRVG